MRHVDFSPFFRTTVGFDRLFQLLDSLPNGNGEVSAYPPYDIERTAENAYRISMAVAGFKPDELKIEVKESLLTVTGEKTAEEKGKSYLHRGIAARSFERRFQLADYVEVKGAEVKDGMLHVDLVREIPEKMKPRTIAIATADGAKTIEHKSAA
ncbi:MAG: Hsp20 family protein [Hyphomicrobiaceae bacterium]